MNEKDYALLRYMYIHEPLHLDRPEAFDLKEKYYKEGDTNSEILSIIHGFCEDDVMERQHAKLYRGDAADMSLGNGYCMADNLSMIRDNNIGDVPLDEFPDDIRTAAVMAGLCEASRADWDNNGEPLTEEYLNAVHPTVRAEVERLIEEGLVDELRAAETPEEAYKVAQKIFVKTTGEDEPPPEDAGECEGDCDGSQGEDSEEGEGKKASSSGMSEVDSDEAHGDKQARKEFQNVKWEDLALSDHSKGSILDQDPEGQHIEYDERYLNTGEWQPHPDSAVRVRDYTHKSGRNDLRINDLESRALANRVRRLIQARRKSKFESEKEHGKIHNSNLYRVACPQVGDGSWNRKIFKRRVDAVDIDTAVTILVDWSGSMYGTKMQVAASAAASLNEVFNTALKVPVEILSFATSGGGVENAIIKPFHEHGVSSDDIGHRFTKFEYHSGGNADADSVLWANDRLEKRKERRRILLVLSDGSPTCAHNYGSASKGLSMVVGDINRKGAVEIYGIGICDDNVKYYYGDHAKVIKQVEDLNTVLIDTLTNHVLKL